MAKTDFHEIEVPVDQASAFATALRDAIGDTEFDRQDVPRLAYRDGSMIVPGDWIEAAEAIDIGGLASEGEA